MNRKTAQKKAKLKSYFIILPQIVHTYCTQSGDENASFHKIENDSLINLYVETNLLRHIKFYMLFSHEW